MMAAAAVLRPLSIGGPLKLPVDTEIDDGCVTGGPSSIGYEWGTTTPVGPRGAVWFIARGEATRVSIGSLPLRESGGASGPANL